MSKIVDFAAAAAEELKSRFADEPQSEFLAWLQLALRREAMVTVAYDDHYIRKQIRTLEDRGVPVQVTQIVHRALASAWAQEEGHQHYLKAVLDAVNPPESFLGKLAASFQGTLGTIEGRTIGDLASSDRFARAKARLALALGSLIQDVPDFVSEIQGMSFESFAFLNADLEETAIHGYQRMRVLLRILQDQSDFRVETTLRWDLERLVRDETYHNGLFNFLGHLFDQPPPGDPAGWAGGSTVSAVSAATQAVNNGIRAAQMLAYKQDHIQDAISTIPANNEVIKKDAFIMQLSRWAREKYSQVRAA
ncbi:MAG TPA: hypothetical protein VNZ47_10830 [Candidatus Dormibacteraeota bacterium]|jgi:hypothetical protein|nr:hypothetical protein [Candidatus Dormibacteraeota bacterium]